MRFHKKAQGLPITTIVIAVLSILVLVVMFAIFTGRISLFGRALSACPGVCIRPYQGASTSSLVPGQSPCFDEQGNDLPNAKPLPGSYAQAGQDLSQPKEKLWMCTACCVSVE